MSTWEVCFAFHMHGWNQCKLLHLWLRESVAQGQHKQWGSSACKPKKPRRQSSNAKRHFPLLLPLLKQTLQLSATPALHLTLQSGLRAPRPDCSRMKLNWLTWSYHQGELRLQEQTRAPQCKAWKTHSTRSGPHPRHCHLVQPLPVALGGEGHALAKEIASVTQSLFSLDSNMHYSGWYPELPSELLGISIMRWQLMEPRLPAGPCKLPLLFLLSVNLHPHLLTAFNSKLRELLESFCLQNWDEDHLYDINCIIKSVRSEPYLITHLFQAETVNIPLSAFNPQNICTLAVRFVSAKQ